MTIIGHGAPHCTNPVVGAAAVTTRFTSKSVIQGSWNAFKWSTGATSFTESQSLSCIIGLSEAASTVDVEDCELGHLAV